MGRVGVGVVSDVSVLTEAWKTRARKTPNPIPNPIPNPNPNQVLTEAWKTRARNTPELPAGAAYSKVRGAPTRRMAE